MEIGSYFKKIFFKNFVLIKKMNENKIFSLVARFKYLFILTFFLFNHFGCYSIGKKAIPKKSSAEIVEIQKTLKKQEILIERLQALIADQIMRNNDLEQIIPPRDLLESLQNVYVELQNKTNTIEKNVTLLQKKIEKYEIKKDGSENLETNLDDDKNRIILGLISLQAGNPELAKEYLDEILLEKKQTKLKGEILMAIGHSFLSKGHAKQAASHYGIFLREYPKSPQVPQALYYLGVAMEKLGEKKKQKVLLKDLIKKFPNSQFSLRAKQILAKKS